MIYEFYKGGINMLKEILLTHKDMDGAGCRVIFEIAHAGMSKGYDFDVMHCANGTIDQDAESLLSRHNIDRKTEIFFADIAPHREMIEILLDNGFKIRIFDHHKTNLPLLDIDPSWDIRVENDLGMMFCGTSLLYQYYSKMAIIFPKDKRLAYFKNDGNKKLMADFVENVRLYDTWEWKRNNIQLPKDLHTLYFLLGMDNFCKRFITRIRYKYSGRNLMLDTDWEFINSKNEYESKVIQSFGPDNVITIDVRGYKTGLALGTRGASASDVAYNFLKNNPDYDIFINFTLTPHPSYYSLRCIKGYDIAKLIAEPLGGGGHEQAAGIPLPKEVHDEIIEILVRELNRKIE